MNIHIFGLGAIGSNILSILNRIYPEHTYFGYDYDIVEERNIRTQSYFLPHLNKPKAVVMPAILTLSNRSLKYNAMNLKITKESLSKLNLSPNDLILDCFDNPESRTLLTKLNIPTLHIGFSPEFTAEIIWDETYDVPGEVSKDIDICTLNSAYPFILGVTSLASEVIVNYLTNKVKDNYLIIDKTKRIKMN